ncbi:hypothetical protein HPB49_009880 [Dermacentor silvarum]|uniref:Uncharacterized protein n=1 Tax=Dermacentor silvarum TaxID=543639 RepID=A0ACB8C8R8_DERSI|nr:hypothetical protein HPB49_009880 [Dermacentor silvarum]
MIGTTSNQGTLFLYSVMKAVPWFHDQLVLYYRSAVEMVNRPALRRRDEDITEVMKAYFLELPFDRDTKDVMAVLSDILGDGVFVCPATLFVDESSQQKIPVLRHTFNYRSSLRMLPTWFRAAHRDDLTFDLGSLVFLGDESGFGSRNPTRGFRPL